MYIKTLWGSFTLHKTLCSLHFDKPQKNEIRYISVGRESHSMDHEHVNCNVQGIKLLMLGSRVIYFSMLLIFNKYMLFCIFDILFLFFSKEVSGYYWKAIARLSN